MSQVVLRSPQQASQIFNLSGPRPPRLKSMFCMRFVRAGTSSNAWINDLPFLVKNVDRPHVTPTVEEINQYNKKRQIHTGYKIQPIRMSFYDTVDSLAMQMWSEYSQYYFGDFRQSSESAFQWDVTSSSFLDDGNGFGFSPSPAASGMDSSSSFFFQRIEVYQVFGNKFVQFDLINPKITAFEPDDLDYTNAEISIINATFAYEAINYANNNVPQDIANSTVLSTMFKDMRLNGNVVAPVDPSNGLSNVQNTVNGSGAPSNSAPSQSIAIPQSAQPSLRSYGSSTSSGELSSFGNYSFGSVSGASTPSNPTVSYASDVAYAAATNPSLAAALSINNSKTASSPPSPQAGVSASAYDVAQGAVNAAANGGASYLGTAITQSVIGSALVSGQSPSQQVSGAKGLALSADALGLYNAQRSPTSQIGFNSRKA